MSAGSVRLVYITGMNKHVSKGSRSLIVVVTVLLLSLVLLVPYGNRLMDKAASMLDPMKYRIIVAMATTPNSRAQMLLRTNAPPSSELFRQNLSAVMNASEDVQNFTAVIILTYMRSGSSLTGEIMQQHPDSFYVYEPLRMLQTAQKNRAPLTYLNGTSINYGDYNETDVATQTLRAWITCDLLTVYQKGLSDTQFMSYGKKTAYLSDCLKHQTKGLKTATDYCVKKLRVKCLASKYRVIKTIRTRMSQVQEMMSEFPKLKIIHLVRDPRDTMMSQKARSVCGKGGADELALCTAKYCSHLSDDIAVMKKESVFKNRVLSVFFEDLAFRALEVCREMYNFVKIELSESIKEYVYNLTADESKDGCKVCQENWQVGKSKLNATTHVEKWRTKMQPGFRVLVDILCKDSISYLNYSFSNPLLR